MPPSASDRTATLTSRHYLPLQNVHKMPYDIELRTSGQPTAKFRAHRLILAAVSSVLHEVLVELSPNDQQCCLILPDVSPDAIQNMLTFIYSGGSLTLRSRRSFVQFSKLVKLLELTQSDDIIVLSKGNGTSNKHVNAAQLQVENQRNESDYEVDNSSNDHHADPDDEMNEILKGTQAGSGDQSSSDADPLAVGQTFENSVSSNVLDNEIINSDNRQQTLKNFDNFLGDNDMVPPKVGTHISPEDIDKVQDESGPGEEIVYASKEPESAKEGHNSALYSHTFTRDSSSNRKVNLFKCKLCPYSCNDRRGMINHVRTHTGERPFTCNQCSNSFSKQGTLRRHMLIHTDQKPYKCDQCPKSFAELSSLRAHQFNHMGIKPFKCEKCSSSFVMQKWLNHHLRVHHGGKSFQCDQCYCRFALFRNLKKHVCSQPSQKQY